MLFLTLMLLFSGMTVYAAQPKTTLPDGTAPSNGPVGEITEHADDGLPTTPDLLAVRKKAYNKLKLTWTQAEDADGYLIYRKTGSESYKRIAVIRGNSVCSYTDKNFICNKKYTYAVKSYVKSDGQTIKSKASNKISKKSKYIGMQKADNCLYYFDKNYKCYRKVDGSKKMICLTYDDGPSPNTNTILNILKKYDSTATFFVVGNRVGSYRSTVKKAYKYNCQIASHTYSHATLTSLSASGIRSQMSKTDAAIKKIIGEPAHVMRPPGGSYNSTVKSTVRKPIIYWSIDTRDWATRNSGKTVSSVLNNARDGDIVLMHDLYEQTAAASKTIIPTLVKRGYQLVTIDEMAALRGGMKNGSVYSSFRE